MDDDTLLRDWTLLVKQGVGEVVDDLADVVTEVRRCEAGRSIACAPYWRTRCLLRGELAGDVRDAVGKPASARRPRSAADWSQRDRRA